MFKLIYPPHEAITYNHFVSMQDTFEELPLMHSIWPMHEMMGNTLTPYEGRILSILWYRWRWRKRQQGILFCWKDSIRSELTVNISPKGSFKFSKTQNGNLHHKKIKQTRIAGLEKLYFQSVLSILVKVSHWGIQIGAILGR